MKKRILCFFLVLTMAFACTIPAFAGESFGTVTYYNHTGNDVTYNLPRAYIAATIFYFGEGIPSLPTANPYPMPGYTFLGWFDSDDNRVESIPGTARGNIDLYAHWSANSNTPYTVLHFFCEPDSDFYLYQTDTPRGTTDTAAFAEALKVKGFKLDTSVPDTKSFGLIYGDGSLVLSLYYRRVMCDISFDSLGGSAVEGLSLPLGSTVPKPDAPERYGFDFAGWYSDEPLTSEWNFESDTVEGDTVLYAKWTPVPPFTLFLRQLIPALSLVMRIFAYILRTYILPIF